ncbi:hypothetical protein FRC19_002332 [Serendipita sp. 401]|nr:hypothetical protein FRC18_002791 [Serendipita sp. 400]KAG8813588.1 hypothetical protein FRC19_002332 [Serendipita sp. 401]
MASYVIGLALELFSFSMMMGRIAYLSKRTKASNSSRRTAALPILQALQRHGAYYFAAVIFSMAFTVGAAFSKPLARTVVNSGMAVNLTSIACNRVIFAFRGLYLDFNTDNLRSRPIPPPSNRGKSVDDAERSLPDNGVMSTDADAYEDEYIAYTRHDMTTRDLGSKDEDQSDRASEKVPTLPLPTTLFTFPANGKRPRRSKFPFHSHHESTSSNFTRDSSREPGTNESKQARQNRSLSPSFNSQSPLVPIPATIAATTPDSIQITKATSPTSLKSMARGVLKSPPMSPISPGFGRVSESSNGEGGRPRQGTEKTLFPSSPPSLEHVRRTPSSSGTKRHSFWWTCPGSKGSGGADALSIAERAGMGNEGDWRDGPDAGVGASGTGGGRGGVMEISSRPRGRERHPLDHQYEMETLYIDPIDRVLGTQDDDHD